MIEAPPLLTVRKEFRRPTPDQIAAFRDMPTSFVADALGGGGALSLVIRPIGEGRDIKPLAVGPAITAGNGPADVLATVAALNFIETGDILVATFDAHQGCAAAGDRVMGMLKNAGGAGFVTDGPMRDYAGIVDVGLPVWCSGLSPASPFMSGPGKVGHAVQIGGQQVESGDMIVADFDGVVVVPFAQIDQVIERMAVICGLEAELDAEVAAGRKVPQNVLDILSDGRARFMP